MWRHAYLTALADRPNVREAPGRRLPTLVAAFKPPPSPQQPGYPVTLTVTSPSGAKPGFRTVTREWMAKGETARTLTLAVLAGLTATVG